jgi:hypothetical protein
MTSDTFYPRLSWQNIEAVMSAISDLNLIV